MQDPNRSLLRHLVATILFRGNVAVREAPKSFATFKPFDSGLRTPGEILAHIGDLLEGSVDLLRGEMPVIMSKPVSWDNEIVRFFAAGKELDSFLASDESIQIPVEKLIQGPIADALTHIGQIIYLRRAAGSAVRSEAYFQAEI